MREMLRRLERLEREQPHKGSCLACALSRLDGEAAECDRQSCGYGLADILMRASDEPVAAT